MRKVTNIGLVEALKVGQDKITNSLEDVKKQLTSTNFEAKF